MIKLSKTLNAMSNNESKKEKITNLYNEIEENIALDEEIRKLEQSHKLHENDVISDDDYYVTSNDEDDEDEEDDEDD